MNFFPYIQQTAAISWEGIWTSFWDMIRKIAPTALTAVVIFVIGFLAVRIIPRPISAILNKSGRIDEVAEKYILRTVKAAIWVITIISIMDCFGFPIGSFLTLLAALGAAVALAVKDNLSNFASGVVLLFTKPFKAGDYIEVNGQGGCIRSIEIMHTYLDTPGNMCIAIPNTQMMTATITNYSTHDVRRLDLSFSISYESDILKVKDLLLQMAKEHDLVLSEPDEPFVAVKSHEDSAIVMLVRVWCKTEEYWNLQFDMMERVKLAFDANGITIPFNQLDVRMHEPQSSEKTHESV